MADDPASPRRRLVARRPAFDGDVRPRLRRGAGEGPRDRRRASDRPGAPRVAPPIPILGGRFGLLNSLRTMRLPDPASSASLDGVAPG
jgi:hypothetical protein